MATFVKRKNGHWQARIRKKGYPMQSNIFINKAQAQKWARLVESEMDRGMFVSTAKAESTTLDDLLERYKKEVLPTKKSQRQVISTCNVISSYIGHYAAAALTPELLAKYREKRLQSVKGHTVRKDLLLIRRILSYAQKEWGIHLPRGNPLDMVSIPSQPKGRDRRLEGDEEQRLLKAATEYGGEIKSVIQFAIGTGTRRGEIHRLRWKDVDLENSTAILRDTKNGEDRKIPLSKNTNKLLRNIPRHFTGKVFSMRPDSITQAFERVCKIAEIKGLRFHDLRHEATSRFFEKGLNIMEVSAITGHKDLSMLKRYTHLKAENLVKKLNSTA